MKVPLKPMGLVSLQTRLEEIILSLLSLEDTERGISTETEMMETET